MFSNNCSCVPLLLDAVTCVQFNPVDDGYFLSGALDDKLRIWSIADHQVVDWIDLREMITAVSYTPDGEVLLGFLFDFPFRPGKLLGFLAGGESNQVFLYGFQKAIVGSYKGTCRFYNTTGSCYYLS